jgi:hypothetical protein
LIQFPTPGDRSQFEANADRARERAAEILATNLAEQAEQERRVEAGTDDRGPIAAFVDRIRAVRGAIRGG